MKKIISSVLGLLFLASASMANAGTDATDKTVVASAKTEAQVQQLLKEGC
jgi:hypothetical protein